MSCITIAHQCGRFLGSLIRDQLTGSLMRLGRAVCVCVFLFACMPAGVYLCICVPVPSPLYPSSTLSLLTACVSSFSHSYSALAEALFNKHRKTSHHRCLICMQHQHTTKEQESCSCKHRYMWLLGGFLRP